MNLLVHTTILLIHFHFFTEKGGTSQERKDEGYKISEDEAP